MQVLFRAKEKNSNNYVIGYEYYNHVEDEYYITHYVSGSNHKIDRTTRSINIEDMLDSNGNKIFASLQEFGKGGDVVTDGEYDFVVIFNGRSFDLMFVEDNTFAKFNEWDDWNKFTKKEMQKLTKKETT